MQSGIARAILSPQDDPALRITQPRLAAGGKEEAERLGGVTVSSDSAIRLASYRVM